jgi:alcohol dehydrogenase class IV
MDFIYTMPTLVHFGRGISRQTGDAVRSRGAGRALLVCDKRIKAAGLVEGVRKSLKEAGVDALEYDGVVPNAPDRQVQEAADLAKDFRAGAVVAIGGGSVIDTAKAVNILLSNPGPIKNYCGINLVKNPVGPLFAIPTTAGSGSEVTVACVVTDTREKRKMTIFGWNVAPTMALADPELTVSLPPSITASTGMDALTPALESYISRLASPITDTLAWRGARSIARSLRKACENGDDINAREDMLLGSLLAGMCFSSACLGLAHSMAHAIETYCGVPHGVASAVSLPCVMAYNAPAVPPGKMRSIAEALGLAAQGKSSERICGEIATLLTRLSGDLGIPRIRAAGIPKEILPTLAKAAMSEFSTQTAPRTPTVEEMTALFEAAW